MVILIAQLYHIVSWAVHFSRRASEPIDFERYGIASDLAKAHGSYAR